MTTREFVRWLERVFAAGTTPYLPFPVESTTVKDDELVVAFLGGPAFAITVELLEPGDEGRLTHVNFSRRREI